MGLCVGGDTRVSFSVPKKTDSVDLEESKLDNDESSGGGPCVLPSSAALVDKKPPQAKSPKVIDHLIVSFTGLSCIPLWSGAVWLSVLLPGYEPPASAE